MIKYSAVALSALDYLLRFELGVSPAHRVRINLGLHYLFNRLVTHPTNHVQGVLVVCQRCTLSWCRSPSFAFRLKTYMNSETFSLLHTLDVRLQTTSQLLHKFVARDVLSWTGRELASSFFLAGLRFNKHMFRLGSLYIPHFFLPLNC